MLGNLCCISASTETTLNPPDCPLNHASFVTNLLRPALSNELSANPAILKASQHELLLGQRTPQV